MTSTDLAPRHRDRALALADSLAEHLRDPRTIHRADTGTDPTTRWKTTSLASGYAGISLLFSNRSLSNPVERQTAHHYLSLAGEGLKGQVRPHYGLFYEVAGLGFALHMAHLAGGGYEKALAVLDARAAQGARGLCHVVNTVPLGSLSRFDVLDGLAGLGRYLLLRGLGGSAVMEEVLVSLTSLVSPCDHFGHTVPRYWSSAPPNWLPSTDPDLKAFGHLNLGVAHGVAGPLALLSLAHADGVAVEGQDEAIRQLVELLMQFQQHDVYGPFWPTTVSLRTFHGSAPGQGRGRVSWCYGAPGVSRALQLAGHALERDEWIAGAHASIEALVRLPLGHFGADHWSLCHGWAGVMHLLGFFTDKSGGNQVGDLIDVIAERIIDTFETQGHPPLEIGFDGLRAGHEPAGFLEGAAGLALVLDSYANPGQVLPWDSALMVK